MHHVIEKYGAQTISEVLDIAIIKGSISNDEAREFCLKHGFIKKTTKMVHANMYSGSHLIHLFFRNGRGQRVLDIHINPMDLPTIKEEINQIQSTL